MATAFGGTNSSTFQDFLNLVNSSEQFKTQLNTYLQQHDVQIVIGPMNGLGSSGQNVPVLGITDANGLITITSLLPDDPFKSPGYVLAEVVAHELGHYFDPEGPRFGGDGLTGEGRAEINAYNVLSEADLNLFKAGKLQSAGGGDLFKVDSTTGLPLSNDVTLYDAADHAIVAALNGNSKIVNELASTCGINSACEATVAAALGQTLYNGYYRNGSGGAPAISVQSGSYLLQSDTYDSSRINIINTGTGATIQTLTTIVLPDGSLMMSV